LPGTGPISGLPSGPKVNGPLIIFFMFLQGVLRFEKTIRVLQDENESLKVEIMNWKREIYQRRRKEKQFGIINEELLWSADSSQLIKELVKRTDDNGESLIVPHFSVDLYGRKQLLALLPTATFFAN